MPGEEKHKRESHKKIKATRQEYNISNPLPKPVYHDPTVTLTYIDKKTTVPVIKIEDVHIKEEVMCALHKAPCTLGLIQRPDKTTDVEATATPLYSHPSIQRMDSTPLCF